ncbi:TPA: ATP-binding protein [Escherichia coli]|nr:ATP-binding protein [Escherichia coli]
MNMLRSVSAIYKEPGLPEYRGNPLMEALPEALSDDEVFFEMSYFPEIDEDIRWTAPAKIREQYVDRIKKFRCPQTNLIEAYRMIYRALRESYAARNPLKSGTVQYLHYYGNERPDIEPDSGYFKSQAETITIVGMSGSGKTTMIEQIMDYFPQVIEHSSYKGAFPGLSKQIVWLKINCPYNSSVRDLCEEILLKLDDASGIERTTPEIRNGPLARQIAQRIKSSFLGILVIDEMQRLKFSRTGGENKLIDFLHEIVDSMGVSMVFCGNPPFDETLARKMRIARRAESGGYMNILNVRYDSQDWQSFIHYLWPLQWTNIETPLSDELNEKLFVLSKGNIGLAQMIYRRAQLKVIGSGNELISSVVLSSSVPVLASHTEEYQEALILGAVGGYDDKYCSVSHAGEASTDFTADRHAKALIPGDIDRPQHKEFAQKIDEAMQNFESKIISFDRERIISRAADNNETYSSLQRCGLLNTDPLNEL